MANVYFNRDEKDSATNAIIEFLRNSGYEESLEEGTGIYDTVIKPNALIYSLFTQVAGKTKVFLSLQQATDSFNAGDISQDEYDAAVDSILSNWFVARNPGLQTYGKVRLYFSEPLSFYQVHEGDTFGSANGVALEASAEQVFSTDSFTHIMNASRNANEYYIDVDVRSAANTSKLIFQDDKVDVTVPDMYYLRASVPADFTPGVDLESSGDFITRTKKAITTRELITDNAIYTVLREKFPQIYALYVAGHGDAEQIRDLVELQGVKIHYGNKADIYIASRLAQQKQTFTVKSDNTLDLSTLGPDVNIAHILSCSVPYTVKVSEAEWGFARYHPESITAIADPGTEAELTWLTDNSIREVQDAVYADDQRVVCYDPQVKHKYPVVLTFNIKVKTTGSNADTASVDVATAAIQYIEQTARDSANYIESELVYSIHSACANVQKVYLPVSCTATIFDPKSGENKTQTVNNFFELSGFGGVSQQISDNTVQFYTDYNHITVTAE